MISPFPYVFTQFKKIIFISLLFLIASNANAQVEVSEGFDQPTGNSVAPLWPANNLPFGWTMIKGNDVNAYWDRMNNPGVLPPCSPHGGTAMVRARTAYTTTANDVSFLVSKPYDLSTRGAITSNVRFWIYRDGTNAVDNIQVYVNNAPVAAGAALFDTVSIVQTIPRYYLSAPAVGATGWYLYGFMIPPAYSIAQLYIIIKVTHGPATTTSNVYIDDFSITTYP
ncbi:MAG: choice-of-anchor J domain-containing protein, partial [Bacteroidota bacterium]